MNRNYLNGFLATAILIGGAMCVTSCKDNVEDLRAELVNDNLSLQEKIKILQDAQTALENAQQQCKVDCQTALTTVKNDLAAVKGDYVKETEFQSLLNPYIQGFVKQTEIQWYLDQINNALKVGDKTYDSLSQRLGEIDAVLAQLQNTDIPAITGRLDQIETDLPTAINKALEADRKANENKAILDALLQGYEVVDGDVSKIQGLLKKAETDILNAQNDATEAKTLANALKSELGLGEDGKSRLDALETRVTANETSIIELNGKLQAITGQLNKLVTGIVLQQVSNPVFGKINLPADIKSGMLMAYFGEAQNVKFPAFASSAYEYDSKTSWLTNEDKARLGVTPETIDGILGVEDGKLRLGTIYMSVNPANLDLSGTKFEFVNSKGETGRVELSELVPNDEELKFGFGRSEEAPTLNGLYTADASVVGVNSIEDLDPVRFTVENGFKSKVEDMLRSHRLSDVASLTKLIFDQFNNKLTAYGVRAAWECDGKKNATYSEFALAATAFKPLSYKFLYGKNFQPIGTISPIEDFTLTDEINIKVPTFEFSLGNVPFNFSFGEINVGLNGAEIVVTFPETKVYEAGYDNDPDHLIGVIPEQEIKVNDFSSLEGKISESITASLKTQEDAIKEAFSQAMVDVAKNINNQINGKMAEFQTNINDQFKDIMGNIEGKVNGYLGTVNNYIDKVNGLINRVNKLLKDPNHYLQVTMLYDAGDGQLHQLSNSATLPSTFLLDGGDGLRLYATSFSGDILVPSYKKFVAVTNVYRTDDKSKTTATDILNEANAVMNWNKVVAGTTTEYGFKLTKDYTYEIVYSSLDYHGVTSTRKFYISAK